MSEPIEFPPFQDLVDLGATIPTPEGDPRHPWNRRPVTPGDQEHIESLIQDYRRTTTQIEALEIGRDEIGPTYSYAAAAMGASSQERLWARVLVTATQRREEFWPRQRDEEMLIEQMEEYVGQIEGPEHWNAFESYRKFLLEWYTEEEAGIVENRYPVAAPGSQFRQDLEDYNNLQGQIDRLIFRRDNNGFGVVLASYNTALEEQELQQEDERREEVGYESTRRFNDQCFLIHYFEKIQQQYQRMGLNDKYGRFCRILDNIEQSNTLVLARPGSPILDLNACHLAPLQPRVRFFKVFNEDAFTGPAMTERTRTHEFQFRTEFDKNNLLGTGRQPGDDVGMESFTWSLEAKTEAEAGKIVHAKGVFLFRNMADFVSKQTFRGGPLKGKSYRYADLGMYAATVSNFKLKIVVGWAKPNEASLQGLYGPAIAKKIIKSATSNVMALYLSVTKYEYDINTDGSLRVTVTYTGNVDQVLKDVDYDIFQGQLSLSYRSPYILAVYRALRKVMQQVIEEEKSDVVNVAGVNSAVIQTILNQEVNNTALLDSIKETSGQNTKEEYFMLQLSRMIGEARASATGTDASMQILPLNSITAGITDLGLQITLELERLTDTHTDASIFTNILYAIEKEIEVRSRDLMKDTHYTFLDRILNNPTNTLMVASIDKKNFLKYQKEYEKGTLSRVSTPTNFTQATAKLSRVLGIPHSRDQASIKNVSWGDLQVQSSGLFNSSVLQDDKYKIYFFKLGDIVEAALEHYWKLGGKKRSDVHFIMGSLQTGEEPFARKLVSLSDLPISLDAFNYWYTTEIIEKDKPRLNLLDFFESLISALIIPSCPEGAGVTGYTANRYTFSVPVGDRDSPDDFPLAPGKSYTNEELRRIKDTAIENTPVDAGTARYIHYNYIFLKRSEGVFTGKGNRADDKKNYIFHLAAGEEKGLVKNISFSAADLEGLQAARDEAVYGFLNARNLEGRLMIFHNADIDMVGNTVFQPGMLVHIAPKYAGMGKSGAENTFQSSQFSSNREISRALGVGGYYQIQDVKGVIDNNGFWTSLRTLFITPGGD